MFSLFLNDKTFQMLYCFDDISTEEIVVSLEGVSGNNLPLCIISILLKITPFMTLLLSLHF